MNARAARTAASLLLAAWLSAALLTAAVVTPAAFAVLPSRALAGTLVGRVLPVVFLAGIAVGCVVAALARFLRARRAPTIASLLIVAACSVVQFFVNPRIARLREDAGVPVDALPPDDTRRVAFGLLHGYSVAGLGVAMLAAALSLSFILYSTRQHD